MIQAEHSDKPYFMDGYLRENLAIAKDVIVKDWDMVFVIDGTEGGGKSAIAQQCAYECDPTINIDRICFTPEEFMNAVKKADKYQAIIFDEGYTGLSSRGTMSDINKSIVEMLAEIRQRNLFIFIVVPTFFDLDRYVALWRSRALIHIYIGEKFKRGFFMFFNAEKKKNLFVYGKKTYDYNVTKSNFYGTFASGYVVDEELYRKKKLESLSNKGDRKKTHRLTEKEHQQWLYERFKKVDFPMYNAQKAKLLGISEPTWYRWVEQNTIDDDSVGN